MSTGMNINFHIDRLILDGVNIPRSQRNLLQASVQSELTRLFTGGGVASGLATGGTLPSVSTISIELAQGNDPVRLGRQIARSVYGGIGK